jgi:transcriptional regulator with XRE-family HTH domain
MRREGLVEHAQRLFKGSSDTQAELAGRIGAQQSEVSRALKGQNIDLAKRIVAHYTGGSVETAFVLRED